MSHDLLVESIKILQKSKYSKGKKNKLTSIQNALKLTTSLFRSDETTTKTNKIINFRNIESSEQIPRILDEFAKNFEIQCLTNDDGASAKNYSLFSVTLLKIIKTLNADKKRGLLSVHAINLLNQMFVNYPLKYKKIETRYPLKFVFIITELAIDAEINLSKNYEFDKILLCQTLPLMQHYYMKFNNPLLQIIGEFDKISKFRLTVSIGQRHKKIVETFLQYAMSNLPLKAKIARAKNLIEKIIYEKNDSIILEYYDVLKLCFNDEKLRPHLIKITKTENRSKRRFANTILDEILSL